jgi:hypothetical protein
VPLAQATLDVLRRFWQVHRNPVLLFPNRQGGLKGAAGASTLLDRGGVQNTLRKVIAACGIKKRSHLIAFAIIPHAGLCRTVSLPSPECAVAGIGPTS